MRVYEQLGKLEKDVFEVEFCDKNGITLATIALESQYLYYCGTGPSIRTSFGRTDKFCKIIKGLLQRITNSKQLLLRIPVKN